MKDNTPIVGLSDAERSMLIDGLRALRKERGKAWNEACDVAEATGKRRPPLRPFGIDDIVRLAKRLGGTAPTGAKNKISAQFSLESCIRY